MKKILCLFLIFISCWKTPCLAQEAETLPPHSGQAARSSAYDSLAVSMASWGIGMAVGIGLLCALLEFSTGAHDHDDDDD